MANPRQRRKARSGTSGAALSKKSKKRHLHKQPAFNGPAVLAGKWDKSKTVRQNYAALGLLSTLNPKSSGGLEPGAIAPRVADRRTLSDLEAEGEDEGEDVASDADAETSAAGASLLAPSLSRKLKPGEARVTRDDQGQIISIEIGGEKGAPPQQVTPWGAPMKDSDAEDDDEEDEEEAEEQQREAKSRKTTQGMPIESAKKGIKRARASDKTPTVKAMERAAAQRTKTTRQVSAQELEWLLTLFSKHGRDVEAMARDRKLNTWQKTQGELGRAIRRAGGFEALQAIVEGESRV